MSSNIERCYQCGQCTAICPMAEQEQTYKIRRYLQMEKLGLEKEVTDVPHIFYCTTCYKCQDNCPQGVKIVDGLLEIRENAVQKGIILPSHRKIGQMLVDCGHAVPINDSIRKVRLKLGLDEMPPTVSRYDDPLKEVKKLITLSGFDRIVAEEKA